LNLSSSSRFYLSLPANIDQICALIPCRSPQQIAKFTGKRLAVNK